MTEHELKDVHGNELWVFTSGNLIGIEADTENGETVIRITQQDARKLAEYINKIIDTLEGKK